MKRSNWIGLFQMILETKGSVTHNFISAILSKNGSKQNE